MSEIVGTIKISELKIVTKKEGRVEVWSLTHGDETKFIVYKSKIYKLLSDDNLNIED
jgi:hypothetical protein